MNELKFQVVKILEASALLVNPDDISSENTIDFKKFDENPIIKATIKELKSLGVNGKWLFKNGFVCAGMLYSHLLK